jgi:parallel beta-helix repeat protein
LTAFLDLNDAMKKWMRIGVVVMCICVLGSAPSDAQTNIVTGQIVANTTWSGTNLIQGTVSVLSNAVLTIAPGARVLMDSAAVLIINGRLSAEGTVTAPIYFTRSAAGKRWKGIRFNKAQTSRFEHCIFEYAECGGSHLDYYDNDCNSATAAPLRNYHEAIVAVASTVEFESCVFQNLFNSSGNPEGDAVAIMSDDPQNPGPGSAHFNNCRFVSIGQGIHTRFSYVLVENSFFTGHDGDNDDIDMYGESDPPPLIRNNIFLNPRHDDMINPTRCSAIIVGNFISGGDDHGIVLRDKCSPTVMNNIIVNIANGGISVQNQCDAVIVNNTIVNCGRGIRLFDHDQRWGPPYCLSPGSGRATVVNCIIWDCPISFALADSPYSQNRGSYITVLYSDVEGGQSTASVSANSILSWGAGNLNIDPQFTNDFQLRSSSPVIDKGTNPAPYLTNLLGYIAVDRNGIARPLDGDGNGIPIYDLGAFEFLLATADSNGDGIPDGWLHQFRLNPIDPRAPNDDPDNDSQRTFQEWIADTNPTNAASIFRIDSLRGFQDVGIQFLSSSNRVYTVEYSTNLFGPWTNLSTATAIRGTGVAQTFTDSPNSGNRFYRVLVALPPAGSSGQ